MKKLTLGMAMFLCGGSVALAQSLNESWYVAPSINWVKPDTGFGVDKSDIGGGGVRFGKAISPNADFQLGTTYARINDNGIRYEQYTAGVDGLYLFSRSNFRPFLLAGIGAEYDKKGGPAVSASKTSPYIDAGLGIQYAFSDKVALQADYRRVLGFVSNDSLGASRPKNDYLTLGVNIAFGGH